MMEFPVNIINQYLADFLLPFTRISALIMTMVGVGAKTTPPRIKLALAVMLTVVVMPVIPPVKIVQLFSLNTALLVFEQLIIGIMLGFITVLLLETFTLAGQVIAMQTGLGFASLVDPATGTNVPAVGQFFLILSTLIFWLIDGHMIMIQFIIGSFETMPIPFEGFEVEKFNELARWGSWLFASALSLALAPITAMLLINFSFGIVTRAAPQLNIFAIGFPVTMICGLIIMWLTMGNFYTHFELQWQRVIGFSCYLVSCEAP
jgi:flagellar biosynthetic protein FliR